MSGFTPPPVFGVGSTVMERIKGDESQKQFQGLARESFLTEPEATLNVV